MTNRPGG